MSDTEREPKPGDMVCAKCGDDTIEETAWVSINTKEVSQSEGPTDNVWCPTCEDDHASTVTRLQYEDWH